MPLRASWGDPNRKPWDFSFWENGRGSPNGLFAQCFAREASCGAAGGNGYLSGYFKIFVFFLALCLFWQGAWDLFF